MYSDMNSDCLIGPIHSPNPDEFNRRIIIQ